MAQAYGTRPSSLLGLPASSWTAWSLDAAVLALADRVDEAVESARSKGGKPELVAHRVELAVRRLLTTQRERDGAAREHAERLRRRRRVEHVHELGPRGEVLGLRVIVHEEPEA